MKHEARAVAAVSGGIVYVTDLDGVIAWEDGVRFSESCTYVLRASDGRELWRAPTNGGLRAQPPIAAHGLAVAAGGPKLRALRGAGGHELWNFSGGELVSTTLLFDA